jgi:uncharacterized protein (DUF433 family)
MKCLTCTATIDGSQAILGQGRWHTIKLYNRVCIHGINKGKPCINPTKIPDKNLTWEHEYKKTNEEITQKINYLTMES